MSRLSALLLLLVPAQDVKPPDDGPDRAKRAAIVDRVMAEPLNPVLQRPVPIRQFDVKVNVVSDRRLLALEPKVPAAEAGQAAPIPGGFRPINGQEMALSSSNFDRWLFEDDTDEATRRGRLYSMLTERIQKVGKDRRLDLDQVRKLRLAGSGDIKRLLDRVAEKRSEFEQARNDINAGRGVLVRLEADSRDFRLGPFYGDSLFAKTLKKIDDDERTARFGPK